MIKNGFTIIEALITALIICIIAVIAIPIYDTHTKKSYVAEGLAAAEAVKMGVTTYYSEYGELPTLKSGPGNSGGSLTKFSINHLINVADPESFKSNQNAIKYIFAGEGNGVILIGYTDKVYEGGHLSIVPTYNKQLGSISWECYNHPEAAGGLPSKYVPPLCDKMAPMP